jgi:hypothetical protein
MDREALERALVQAEMHGTLAERHVDRQHEIIANLEMSGCDSAKAKELLEVFLTAMAAHIRTRDRFFRRLYT